MRRFALLGIMLPAMLAAGTLPAVADGLAEVIHGSWPCHVGWSDATWDLSGECEVQNVLTASGEFYLVLHGQIPDEAMAAFEADDSPKTYPTCCLVNWRFWDDSGFEDTQLWTESVRKFTPNGQMTEVCKPPVVAVIPSRDLETRQDPPRGREAPGRRPRAKRSTRDSRAPGAMTGVAAVARRP